MDRAMKLNEVDLTAMEARCNAADVPALIAEVRRLRAALQAVADFDHAPGCKLTLAPVYECSCYDESQWDIANKALGEEGGA